MPVHYVSSCHWFIFIPPGKQNLEGVYRTQWVVGWSIDQEVGWSVQKFVELTTVTAFDILQWNLLNTTNIRCRCSHIFFMWLCSHKAEVCAVVVGHTCVTGVYTINFSDSFGNI